VQRSCFCFAKSNVKSSPLRRGVRGDILQEWLRGRVQYLKEQPSIEFSTLQGWGEKIRNVEEIKFANISLTPSSKRDTVARRSCFTLQKAT
jgi:hypothetical protein